MGLDKFVSRKWTLAVFFSLTSTIAIFSGFMDGGTYVAAATLILGLYNATNYMGKKLNKENEE